MPLTRREFLGRAAAALALPRVAVVHPALAAPRVACTILDLGDDCTLSESLAGYRMTLANAAPRVPVLVVPAALELPREAIGRHLGAGGMVVLESGAAFGSEHALTRWRNSLRRYLGIRIAAPVPLSSGRVPYVDFTWPQRALVRDFSVVVPVVGQQGEIIATAQGLPVALRRHTSQGTLVFLGSPIGPALWAGDVEARRWILGVLAS